MTTYVVVKRMQEDRLYMPGEVLVDPPNVGILLHRGFLQIVPDDYGKQVEVASTASRPPTFQEAVDMGHSEEAAKSLSAGRETKKVLAEREKINARTALREARGADELERLAVILGTNAEGVLDLTDEEYEEVLKENPKPLVDAPTDAAAESPGVEQVEQEKRLTPRQELTAMADDELAVNANKFGVLPEGGLTGENRKDVIDEIMVAAGYKEAPPEGDAEAQDAAGEKAAETQTVGGGQGESTPQPILPRVGAAPVPPEPK